LGSLVFTHDGCCRIFAAVTNEGPSALERHCDL